MYIYNIIYYYKHEAQNLKVELLFYPTLNKIIIKILIKYSIINEENHHIQYYTIMSTYMAYLNFNKNQLSISAYKEVN